MWQSILTSIIWKVISYFVELLAKKAQKANKDVKTKQKMQEIVKNEDRQNVAKLINSMFD